MKNILIIGGGTCGWMTALFLNQHFGSKYNISLVSSKEIGTIGVGESTIPHIIPFLEELGIYTPELIQKCNASIKLGILFKDWNTKKNFIHPFIGGLTSHIYDNKPFAYWYKKYFSHRDYDSISDISQYLFQNNKIPVNSSGELESDYALHIDAFLLGQLLEDKAISAGVIHIESKVTSCSLNGNNINEVHLINGETLSPDMVFDCSGFRSLGISKMPGNTFTSYNTELPCEMAFFGRTKNTDATPPYTLSQGLTAGWAWKIPLANRTSGNGYVFSQAHISQEDAMNEFMKFSGAKREDIRKVIFKNGIYKNSWVGNCIGLGLSYGFIEPLEATGIYLYCKQLEEFKKYHERSAGIELYNKSIRNMYNEIKDFIVLHYCSSDRNDSPFWRYFKNINYTDEFNKKIRSLKKNLPNDNFSKDRHLFKKESYTRILIGQGFYDNLDIKDTINLKHDSFALLKKNIEILKKNIQSCTSYPSQDEYIKSLSL